MAEVMAAFHAIQFSREAGFFEVIFEGDAAQVVNEVNMQNSPNFTIAGHFIEGIQQELTYLQAAHFIHVPRVCNSVMMCKLF
jgi:ribonuclease HI